MKSHALLTAAGTLALAALVPQPALAKPRHSISLAPISSVAAGSFLTSAAEIGAHDPETQRLFIVNAQAARIDVIDIANPAEPVLRDDLALDVTPYGKVANSVAVHDGIIAVAVEAADKTQPGKVVFFDTGLQFLAAFPVGELPDMVTFSPSGRYVLVANEGEPNPDYTVDPEGSVSVIDLAAGVTQATVRTAGFAGFNGFSRADLFNGTGVGSKPAIRIYGPDATVAQDIEPEYISVSHDSKTAWVTLQENNALAVIDLATATVTSINGLGVKDHGLADNGFGSSNALDASDRDGIPVANNGRINLQNWPVKGFFLPDGIASFKIGNETYPDFRYWGGRK